ncbi:hypothetical protein INR49_018837, partial [Caranx melampygus]
SGPADQLSSLLETTQKLLEPFPCRPPPVFTPWFPSNTADRRLPIRPARPAPVITASGPSLVSHSRSHAHTAVTRSQPENKLQKHEVSHIHAETPRSPPETTQTSKDVLCLSETPAHLLPASPCHRPPPDEPQTGRGGFTGTDSPIKRSWSVWRSLSRSVRSSRLPTCNANIQRERAEIWVFCDVLYSEQVGRLLKEELQLSGRISLSVRRLGNVFSA